VAAIRIAAVIAPPPAVTLMADLVRFSRELKFSGLGKSGMLTGAQVDWVLPGDAQYTFGPQNRKKVKAITNQNLVMTRLLRSKNNLFWHGIS
jgi:hypothetical protein